MKTTAYRLNRFELDLIERLFDSTFKEGKFLNNRYPEVYYGDFYDFKKPNKKRPKRIYRNSDILDSHIEEIYPIEIITVDSSFEYPYDIEFLGVYKHNSKLTKDGHIEIYGDKITECAYSISNNLNMDFHQVRSLLQTIVLVHEFGHWFTHACYADLRDSRMSRFSSMSINSKETMAQLSVIWAVGNLKNPKVKQLLKIMNHLTQGQSLPYRLYLELGPKQSQKQKIINRFIKMLDFEEDNIDYLLLKTPDYLSNKNTYAQLIRNI